jgi:hypothetical protein
MKYEITTKQGKKYTVSVDSTWLWIEIERDLGYTITEAEEKLRAGSLDVLTCMLFKAAKGQGMTKLPSQQAWVTNEFEGFEVVEEVPKES